MGLQRLALSSIRFYGEDYRVSERNLYSPNLSTANPARVVKTIRELKQSPEDVIFLLHNWNASPILLEFPDRIYGISWAQEAIPNSQGMIYRTSKNLRVIVLVNQDLASSNLYMMKFLKCFPQNNGWSSVLKDKDDKFYIYYTDLKA